MAAPLILVSGSLLRGTATAAADELADAVKRLATEAIQTAISWEQLELRLQTTTGSAQSAEIVFENLRMLARETPLEVEGLTNAFVQLHEAGIAPTDELLTSLGNIAAAFGRDITDVSTAAVAAVGGQFDALRRFGIEVETVGDKVRLSYRDQAIEVANSTEAIANALNTLAGDNFAQAMEDQANRVKGAWGDLEDASADLAASIIDAFNLDDTTVAVLQLAADAANGLRRAIDPTLDEEIERLKREISNEDSRLEQTVRRGEGFAVGTLGNRLARVQARTIEADLELLRRRLEELESQRDRQIQIAAEASSPDQRSGPPSLPVQGSGQPPTHLAGLRVEPSLCECIASLIESNRSPLAAAGMAAVPSQIDGSAQSGVPGTDAPVSPEAVERLIAAEDAACEYAESIQKIDEDTRRAQEVSQLFGNAASTAMAQIRDGSFSAADALDSLLDRLFQLLVINPFEQALTGFVEGLLTPTGSAEVIQSDFFGPTATGAVVAHTGGIVGASDLPTRLVSASVAGIAADEFPAVLRRGEGVFTPQQMAALAPAGGGGDVTVNVIDRRSGDSAPVEVTEKQTNGRREIEVLIVDTVSRDIGRRGAVGQAIESTFGARRQGVR